MSDDKNCACQPDVAIEFDNLRIRYKDIAAEALRLRHILQKENIEMLRWKDVATRTIELVKNAAPYMHEDTKWIRQAKEFLE